MPYLVFVVTCGVPLFLLETTLGQYTQEGGITCWRKLCPLAEGTRFIEDSKETTSEDQSALINEKLVAQ